MNKIEQANILRNELREAANAYYNTSTPLMTDEQYDYKLNKLRSLENALKTDFGSSAVGAPVLSHLTTVNINPPMLSLDKCHSVQGITTFAAGEKLIASAKCDGVSTRLIYKTGKLVSANTRGNGIEGTDITEHIKYYTNVPLTLSGAINIIIDGETIIKHKDFNIIKEEQHLKNSRNAVAGTLNNLDMEVTASRRLSFIAWDLISSGGLIEDDSTYYNKMLAIESLGFEITPWQYLYEDDTIDDINKYIQNVAENYCGIPTDGIVWRINDEKIGKARGKTVHHAKNAIAFKPDYEAVETELITIDYDVSRQGILTPVAVFKPIIIDGTEVSRASLSNLSVMRKTLGYVPYVNEKVFVIKANKIIPMIVDAETADELQSPPKCRIYMPEFCPICGSPLEITSDNGVDRLHCINENCDGKIINKINHFFGKKGLNVKGLSKATIEKLIDWEWVSAISDIFHLSEHKKEWIQKSGFGEKSVTNILTAIDSRRTITISELLSAIGIPKVGLTVAKKIEEVYPDWDSFKQAAIGNSMDKIDGIGEEIAYNLRHYDYSWVDALISNKDISIVVIEKEDVVKISSTSLDGQTIVITGKLKLFKNRAALEQLIKDYGGKVSSAINGKTTLLINNDSGSTSKKNLDAQEKGVPILTEEEFVEKFQIEVS